jgi:ABC-type Fe3+/spermidine/putrescine transport system ATPase subunit
LFDEPFGALDTQTRVHLRREIRALLKKVNVPSIFITHDQEEALELGDRVAVLNVGHIEQIGTPFEIYNHPATEYVATFLGAANVLDAVVRKDYLEIGSAQIPRRPWTREVQNRRLREDSLSTGRCFVESRRYLRSGRSRLGNAHRGD